MNFEELVKTRRSIRKFLSKEVSDELIMKLLEAARWAPSGGNCQPWHFFVIKSKATLGQISEKVYKGEWITQAPVIIVVCAKPSQSALRYGKRGGELYCIQDTAAAIQNILLCAKSIGLGTCWIGAFNETICSEVLGLGDDLRPVAMIPVGYPVNGASTGSRKPISEIATFL